MRFMNMKINLRVPYMQGISWPADKRLVIDT